MSDNIVLFYFKGCDSPASIRSFGSATSLSGSTNGNGGKKYENVVASSSALILHARPDNLPAKPDDEETRHRKEYERMVAAAKKKGGLIFFAHQVITYSAHSAGEACRVGGWGIY